MIHHVGNLARQGRLPGDAPIQYARRDYLASWPRESRETPFAALDPLVAHRLMAAYRDLVRRMSQRGVRILAGTDTPFPYCVPGFALHEELALLVEAGMSPMAALRAATWSPAEFLRIAGDYGSVDAGKVADLVVLDADPLVSIRNTRRIFAVVRRGQVMDPGAIRSTLERVRQ
jgi:imidazolonepropionase-like amidohydrolase